MPRLDAGVAVRPCLGHARSGDAGVVHRVNGGQLACIVDALGHGDAAHAAAVRAVALVREATDADVVDLMGRLNERLKGTVGAAIGLCHVDEATGGLVYVSVGNTTLRRFGEGETRLVSQDGIVGSHMRTPKTQHMSLTAGDVVLMHTDGVSGRFGLEDYPELLGHAPATIARVVVRRFGKTHDDAGCIVLRYGK